MICDLPRRDRMTFQNGEQNDTGSIPDGFISQHGRPENGNVPDCNAVFS